MSLSSAPPNRCARAKALVVPAERQHEVPGNGDVRPGHDVAALATAVDVGSLEGDHASGRDLAAPSDGAARTRPSRRCGPPSAQPDTRVSSHSAPRTCRRRPPRPASRRGPKPDVPRAAQARGRGMHVSHGAAADPTERRQALVRGGALVDDHDLPRYTVAGQHGLDRLHEHARAVSRAQQDRGPQCAVVLRPHHVGVTKASEGRRAPARRPCQIPARGLRGLASVRDHDGSRRLTAPSSARRCRRP
jgi:hypothetical protein